MSTLAPDTGAVLRRGVAIPAIPLALTAERRFDDRRQRALVRYYLAAGAGGLAVGVHSTQFEIHRPAVGLLEPVLELVAEEADARSAGRSEPLVRIAGVCGPTDQAVREAELARHLGYDAVLVSPAGRDPDALLEHYRAIGGVIPLVGFYLQRAVEHLHRCHQAASTEAVPRELLTLAAQVTDANAAVFDTAHDFAGCIPGVHEVLRRQGLLAGTWCLDESCVLSDGQAEEIDRICRRYPHLTDDEFVAEHLDEWLG